LSLRTDRIGEQLRGEIARVLREEVGDPRVRMVTLTHVDVAPDLSHALVMWSVLEVEGEADLEDIQSGLDSTAGFVRRQVAHQLSLRKMPALRFRHDSSIELGSRTLEILKGIRDETEN
jgi:ribosome-binding factor A